MIKNTLLLLVAILSLTTASAAIKLNKIMAIVNGDIITEQEVSKRMLMSNQTKQQAINYLINSRLEVKLAQDNGIQVSSADLNKIVANIAQKNNLSISQLEQELKNTQNLSMSEYKEQLYDQIITNKLRQQMFGKDIQVTDKEIAAAIAKPIITGKTMQEPLYHVIDILIETPVGASSKQLSDAQDTATKILTNLKNNNDVKTAIVNFGNAVQYNDLAVRKLSELPDLFANYVKNMQAGQVAGPIQAPNGLHVLKLIEVFGVPQKIILTKDQARELVFSNKLEEHAQKLIQELRASAYIKIIN